MRRYLLLAVGVLLAGHVAWGMEEEPEFFLRFDNKNYPIKQNAFELSKRFQEAYEEHGQEAEEYTFDLDESLKNIKWKNKFTPAILEVFIELCQESNEQDREKILETLDSREDLLTLILFTIFFDNEVILDSLLKALASKITDQDYLDMLKNDDAFLWQMIDELPSGVLKKLKNFLFKNEAGRWYIFVLGMKKEKSLFPRLFALKNGGVISVYRPLLMRPGERINIYRWDPGKKKQVSFGRDVPLLLLKDGRVVFVRGKRAVQILDPDDPSVAPVVLMQLNDEVKVRDVLLLEDGRFVISLSRGIFIFDPEDPNVDPVPLSEGGYYGKLGLMQDGRIVASFPGAKLRILDPKKPKAAPVTLVGDPEVFNFLVLENGKIVTQDGFFDMVFSVFDSKKPNANPVGLSFPDSFASMIALQGGKFVADPLSRNKFILFDVERPQADPVLLAELGTSSMFFPPQLLLLPGGGLVMGDNDGNIKIFDPEKPDADPIELKKMHDSSITSLILWPLGGFVSASANGKIVVWGSGLFKGLTFKQAILVKLLEKQNALKKDLGVLKNNRLRKIFESLPEGKIKFLSGLGWLGIKPKVLPEVSLDVETEADALLERLDGIRAEVNGLVLSPVRAKKDLEKLSQEAQETLQKIKNAFGWRLIKRRWWGKMGQAEEIYEQIKEAVKAVSQAAPLVRSFLLLIEQAKREASTDVLLQAQEKLKEIKELVANENVIEILKRRYGVAAKVIREAEKEEEEEGESDDEFEEEPESEPEQDDELWEFELLKTD